MKRDQTLTQTQIEDAGGVYTKKKDFKKLPEKIQEHGAVENLDEKGEGSHWVGIKKRKDGVIDYFDSYGVRPSMGVAKNSLILYNGVQQQKLGETNCGQRTLKWLKIK
jgi:hypothetical protein